MVFLVFFFCSFPVLLLENRVVRQELVVFLCVTVLILFIIFFPRDRFFSVKSLR